jgi:hypothetical protein
VDYKIINKKDRVRIMQQYLKSISLLLFLGVVISACAPTHRVVRVQGIPTNDTTNAYYGVTYNNVLISEYTKTKVGKYTTSYDGAWELYDKQGSEIDSWIADKYQLPNSTWYRSTSWLSAAGLIAAWPFVVPIEWIGERIAHDPLLGKKRTVREITMDFMADQYDNPTLKIVEPTEDYLEAPIAR